VQDKNPPKKSTGDGSGKRWGQFFGQRVHQKYAKPEEEEEEEEEATVRPLPRQGEGPSKTNPHTACGREQNENTLKISDRSLAGDIRCACAAGAI
jgi:hypothetical protein